MIVRKAVSVSPPAAAGRGEGHALLASFLGWALDAFDFFVLVFALPAIAGEFNRPVRDIAYAVTITLAFRPIGALVFGWLADRYGRRLPLMLNVIYYSAIEVLSGLAPSYRVFLLLRALYGIGMGGEWGVGASLAMESAPRRLRGLLSGVLQEGYAAGYLFAAVAYYLVFPVLGWRPLFFIGGVPALLALYVRSHVRESAVWEHHRPDTRQMWRSINANLGLFVYLVVLMTAMNLIAHGTQDMYPTFLQNERGLSPREVAVIAIIYNFGALGGGLVFGWLSDRLGRRRSMMLALVLALAVVPLWVYARSLWVLAAGAFLMQFMVQGAWGVVPAHLSELSPGEVRGLYPGMAYQLGVFFAAGVTWAEAIIAARMDYSNALALVGASVCVCGLIAIWVGPERSGADFYAVAYSADAARQQQPETFAACARDERS